MKHKHCGGELYWRHWVDIPGAGQILSCRQCGDITRESEQ